MNIIDFFRYEEDILPTERHWREALGIYTEQLGGFLTVALRSFVIIGFLTVALGAIPLDVLDAFLIIFSYAAIETGIMSYKSYRRKKKSNEEAFREMSQRI